MEWTIRAASSARRLDRIVLSTDSRTIANAARMCNCDVPFLRPQALAQDSTPMVDVIRHALDSLKGDFDLVVTLQPTSPFRLASDIDDCVERSASLGAESVVSVVRGSKPLEWALAFDEGGSLRRLLDADMPACRQDARTDYYFPNGAVYVTRTDYLRRERRLMSERPEVYEMPSERSLDIDTELDLLWGRFLVEQGKVDGG